MPPITINLLWSYVELTGYRAIIPEGCVELVRNASMANAVIPKTASQVGR